MHRPHWNKAVLFVLPALAILMFSFVLPFMAVVNFSVHDVFAGNNFVWAGMRWYAQIMGASDFWATLGRTLLYAALVILIELPLGVWIALNMPRSGRMATFFIMIAAIPLLIPWFVVGLIWKIMSDTNTGPLGSLASTLTQHYDLNDPLVAWGVSASRGAIFRYIEFPRLQRVLIIALLLRLTDSLMVYIEPFMITRGGPGVATTFISQDLIQTAMIEFDFGEASAAALVYFLIMLTLSWALFRIMTAPDA